MGADPARAGSLWDRAPGLISLRDFMEQFRAAPMAAVFANLARASELSHGQPAAERVPADIAEVWEQRIFVHAEALCRVAGLQHSLVMLARLRMEFSAGIKHGAAGQALTQFNDVLISELKDRNLYLAPKDRIGFHDNERLFGDAVFDAFPSARMDIREAGNCWLFGRNNAVVYHLMCAAEFGLRALAADRRVPTPRGPLELEQWGTIIGLLETKTADIDQWPRSLLREKVKAKEFYNTALIQARAFNDGYRRHVMHARGRAYEDDEAQALMGHVRRFMQMLAARISEGAVGPEVWPAGSAP